MSEQPRDEDGRWTAGGSGHAELARAEQEMKDRRDARGAGRARFAEAHDRYTSLLHERSAAMRAADTGRRDRIIALAAQMYGEGSPQHEWAKSQP